MLRITGRTVRLVLQSSAFRAHFDLTCKAENFVDGADSMLQKSGPDHRPGKLTKEGLKRGNMWLGDIRISDLYLVCICNRFKNGPSFKNYASIRRNTYSVVYRNFIRHHSMSPLIIH